MQYCKRSIQDSMSIFAALILFYLINQLLKGLVKAFHISRLWCVTEDQINVIVRVIFLEQIILKFLSQIYIAALWFGFAIVFYYFVILPQNFCRRLQCKPFSFREFNILICFYIFILIAQFSWKLYMKMATLFLSNLPKENLLNVSIPT